MNGATVLVVEDDAPRKSLVSWALSEDGYQVLGCRSLEAAPLLVAQRAPDVVIFNTSRDDAAKAAATRAIRRVHGKVKILEVRDESSRRQPRKSPREATDDEPDLHLHLPFSLEELLAAVRSLAGGNAEP